jgi:hypothetical protein
MNNKSDFQKELFDLLQKEYKRVLSENIKKGIRLAKERKNNNENK